MHPKDALRFIRELIEREQPDLLIWNSCGAFYAHSFHFPGGHTPTADEVRDWYVPLAEKMLTDLQIGCG